MDKPLFIYVGGLPGSGKTLLIEKVLEEYKGLDFEIIDPDVYRKFHPDIDEIKRNPFTAINKTIDFTYEIEMFLLLKAIKNKKNIISVGTLRNTTYLKAFIEDYLYSYTIGLKVMNISLEESRKAVIERFEQQLLNNEFPRYVTEEYLQDSFKGLSNTLKKFSKYDRISFIDIYERGLNKSYPIKIKKYK